MVVLQVVLINVVVAVLLDKFVADDPKGSEEQIAPMPSKGVCAPAASRGVQHKAVPKRQMTQVWGSSADGETPLQQLQSDVAKLGDDMKAVQADVKEILQLMTSKQNNNSWWA